MACQIKRNADGTIAQVLAPNGKDSILYRDIVNNLSNPQTLAQVKQDPYVSMVLGTEYIKGTDVSEIGLAAWSKAYSAGFINQFGDWKTQTIANTDVNGEPNVDVLFPDLKVSNVKEGVDFVFEQNPELASIGTQEQYSEYLDTVFPDSKVKDIVYRGDENYNVGEKILSRVGGNKYTNGIYFAKNRREAAGYINDIKKKTTHVFSAILDLKAPKVTDVYDKEINTNALTETDINNLKSKNIDGLDVGLSGEQGFEYVVFEPEQIHILGSKQDIEGFKKFVSGGQLPSTVDNIINMKRWTQTKNNCPQL